MKVTQAGIDEVMGLLQETVARLTAVSHHPATQLHHQPDPKTWSANNILAHLRACADVWGETIEAMLAQETPTLRHISPRTYLKKTNYPRISFDESFTAFLQQRQTLLKTLQGLAFLDWSRDAIIKDRQHTIFSQCRRMALHEQGHCEQIEALLGVENE